MSDLIRREDAIKATWQEPTYADPLNILTEVRDRIEAIPSADRWIPCSERLPEVHEVVLVTFEYDGDMLVGITERSQGGFWISENVVAWQPLSQPWKGADND